MKRTLQVGLVLVSCFGFLAAASADGDNHQGNRLWNRFKPNFAGESAKKIIAHPQGSRNNRPKWKTDGDVFGESHNNHHHHDEPKPLGRPQGDGRVPVAPPGYVWVNDHFERVKADPKPTGSPAVVAPPGYVWVNDHFERVKAGPRPPKTTGTPPYSHYPYGAPRPAPPATNRPSPAGSVFGDELGPGAASQEARAKAGRPQVIRGEGLGPYTIINGVKTFLKGGITAPDSYSRDRDHRR